MRINLTFGLGAALGLALLGCVAAYSRAETMLQFNPTRGDQRLLVFGDPSTNNPAWQEALMERSLRSVSDVFKAQGFTVDLIPATNLNARVVSERIAHYTRTLGTNDTFVMYSHGHGYPRGTFFGTWSEFADRILALPARHVVIFTMACHSGALTDALKQRKAEWAGRSRDGRSLVVLTPASAVQIAGPSPVRGVGNPFTYAITTAAQGAADGFPGGDKNGRVEMQELVDYVLKTTQEKSQRQGQSPQFAGDFPAGAVFVSSPAASGSKSATTTAPPRDRR